MREFILPPSLRADMPGETPAHIRQRISKRALIESGGKRIAVNLTKKAVAALEKIKDRDGLDNTQAIAAALLRHSLKR